MIFAGKQQDQLQSKLFNSKSLKNKSNSNSQLPSHLFTSLLTLFISPPIHWQFHQIFDQIVFSNENSLSYTNFVSRWREDLSKDFAGILVADAAPSAIHLHYVELWQIFPVYTNDLFTNKHFETLQTCSEKGTKTIELRSSHPSISTVVSNFKVQFSYSLIQ